LATPNRFLKRSQLKNASVEKPKAIRKKEGSLSTTLREEALLMGEGEIQEEAAYWSVLYEQSDEERKAIDAEQMGPRGRGGGKLKVSPTERRRNPSRAEGLKIKKKMQKKRSKPRTQSTGKTSKKPREGQRKGILDLRSDA